MAGLPCDPPDRQGNTVDRTEFAIAVKHVAVGIEPLEIFTHHHKVKWRPDGMRQPVMTSRRSDIGMKIKRLAKYARRVQATFGNRRVIIMRDRPQDHTISRLRGRDDIIGNGAAPRRQRGKTDPGILQNQRITHQRRCGGKNLLCCRHDFRPNAIPVKTQESECHACASGQWPGEIEDMLQQARREVSIQKPGHEAHEGHADGGQ